MPILYLSAAKSQIQRGAAYYRDFYAILQNRVGPDYAIHPHIRVKLRLGIRAVVFDKDRRLRAEGVVSAITRKPSNGVERYDVHIPNLTQVPYSNPPGVNRCGVAFV